LSRRKNLEVLSQGLESHPAVRAWSRIRPDLEPPRRIEELENAHGTYVVRLVGSGENATFIIAKKTLLAVAMTEKAMYTEAMKYLSRPTLQYFGFLDPEDDGSVWSFMADAGEEAFSFKNDEHKAIALEWLADLHTSVPKLQGLPERGLDHYEARMISARKKITENLTHPALRDRDLDLLRSILSRFDYLSERWAEIRGLYDRLPKSCIHADFKKGNLRLRDYNGEKTLLVFDWEESGWGLPGVDMWRMDPRAYWLKVRHRWSGITQEDTVTLAFLGRLLWCLQALDWVSDNLGFEWAGTRTGRKMHAYDEHLKEAITHIPWLRATRQGTKVT